MPVGNSSARVRPPAPPAPVRPRAAGLSWVQEAVAAVHPACSKVVASCSGGESAPLADPAASARAAMVSIWVMAIGKGGIAARRVDGTRARRAWRCAGGTIYRPASPAPSWTRRHECIDAGRRRYRLADRPGHRYFLPVYKQRSGASAARARACGTAGGSTSIRRGHAVAPGHNDPTCMRPGRAGRQAVAHQQRVLQRTAAAPGRGARGRQPLRRAVFLCNRRRGQRGRDRWCASGPPRRPRAARAGDRHLPRQLPWPHLAR